MTDQTEQNFVQLEQCYDSIHAHILRGLLETNDIPCILVGEHHNRMESYLSIALGGIRILVAESDLERARNLIVQNPGEAAEQEEAVSYHKPVIQKPYWRTFALGIIGFLMGAPVMRPKGKHEE